MPEAPEIAPAWSRAIDGYRRELTTRQASPNTLRAYGTDLHELAEWAAGAGIPDHVHWHVVPRWNGDTNFMSVVGDVRVLPEEVPASAVRLKPVFERLRT